MATTIYKGKVQGERLDVILGQYGMFMDNGKAEYNDNRTLIFMKDMQKPLFLYCLSTITHDDLVDQIGDIENIVEVRYSSYINTIEHYAFEGCTSLSAVVGPYGNNLWTIGEGAFYGCSSLTKVEVDTYNLLTCYDYAFEGCNVQEISCKHMPDDVYVLTQEDETWATQISAKILNEQQLLGASSQRPTSSANKGASSGRKSPSKGGKTPSKGCSHAMSKPGYPKKTGETSTSHQNDSSNPYEKPHTDVTTTYQDICFRCGATRLKVTTRCQGVVVEDTGWSPWLK